MTHLVKLDKVWVMAKVLILSRLLASIMTVPHGNRIGLSVTT